MALVVLTPGALASSVTSFGSQRHVDRPRNTTAHASIHTTTTNTTHTTMAASCVYWSSWSRSTAVVSASSGRATKAAPSEVDVATPPRHQRWMRHRILASSSSSPSPEGDLTRSVSPGGVKAKETGLHRAVQQQRRRRRRYRRQEWQLEVPAGMGLPPAAESKNNRAKAKEDEEEEEDAKDDALRMRMRGLDLDLDLDPKKVALGSLTVFCVGFAAAAVVHPDPAFAREVTLDLPDIDFSNFEVPTSPMELLRFLLSNPYAAVFTSVAAYLVIPKAAEILVKYFVVPALILLIAFEASQHPDETISVVASAINQARDHPTITSGVILALLALVLSPYILVAAAVGLLVSGVQLLPDQLKPVLPAPVREVESQIEQLQSAVSPQVKQVRAAGAEALRQEQRLQAEAEKQARRLRQETERRKEEARKEAERRVEEAERRVEEAKYAALAPVRDVQSTVDGAVKQVEEAKDAVVDVATEAAETVAVVGKETKSITKCTDRPTPAERSKCVDDLRAERERAKAKEMREKAARLRANSVKNVPPVPSPPDVGKVFTDKKD